jgi:hypothetical protein
VLVGSRLLPAVDLRYGWGRARTIRLMGTGCLHLWMWLAEYDPAEKREFVSCLLHIPQLQVVAATPTQANDASESQPMCWAIFFVLRSLSGMEWG